MKYQKLYYDDHQPQRQKIYYDNHQPESQKNESILDKYIKRNDSNDDEDKIWT